MKKSILYILLLAAGTITAQTEPATSAPKNQAMPANDTTSVNSQLRQESDLKTMDAVKTQDHTKVTPKATPDTTKIKRNRSSNRRSARP